MDPSAWAPKDVEQELSAEELVEEAAMLYDVSELPVELPCKTHSFLVQTTEASGGGPKPLGFFGVVINTELVKDWFLALLAIFSALASMFTAAFASIANQNSDTRNYWLQFVALAYPLVMMIMLLTRSNEISLRKEAYYMLLKYKIVVDWSNWGWLFDAARIIWLHSVFFWFWFITTGLLAYYTYSNSAEYITKFQNEVEQYTKIGLSSAVSVTVLIVLQGIMIFKYFYSTLMVEESGLITFNKILENKEGNIEPAGVDNYLAAGPMGAQGLHTMDEEDIRDWAVDLYSNLPSRYHYLGFVWPKSEQQIQAEFKGWQAAVAGDLQKMHLESALYIFGNTNLVSRWIYRRGYGLCLLRVLSCHPDFAAMHVPLSWLLRWHFWKVTLSSLVALGLEAYTYWAFRGAWK